MKDTDLSRMRDGEKARVTGITGGGAMGRRLRDMGLVRGTRVTCVLRSPAGDPCAYLIRGALIALRRTDADGVSLERQARTVAAGAVAT